MDFNSVMLGVILLLQIEVMSKCDRIIRMLGGKFIGEKNK